MAVDVVLGLQRGDEGKGRIVDLYAANYDIVARFNGGANAGHTVVPEGLKPIALHQLPSGVAYKNKLNIIGNGVYLDPIRLVEEMRQAKEQGIDISTHTLAISSGAHLVMPHHKMLDTIRESTQNAQGSTKAGIAYVAASKYQRDGLRTEQLILNSSRLREYALIRLSEANLLLSKGSRLSEQSVAQQIDEWFLALDSIKPYIKDTCGLLQKKLSEKDRVLAEGAQAFWLDIDHGMYPHVTSSHTTTGSVLNGLGISHKQLGKVTGVAKVIKSHVGGGPFVTKITDDKLAENIRGEIGLVDSEYGATTKRARHVGYFDLVELRTAIQICGLDELVLTKMDLVERFGQSMKVAVAYELNGKKINHAPSSSALLEKCQPIYEEMPTWSDDISDMSKYSELPFEAQKFIKFIEDQLLIPVAVIGVGPERNQVIFKNAR